MFAMDSSGSVETMFDMSINIAKQIVHGLNFWGGRTRVGVITFADTAEVRHKYVNDNYEGMYMFVLCRMVMYNDDCVFTGSVSPVTAPRKGRCGERSGLPQDPRTDTHD